MKRRAKKQTAVIDVGETPSDDKAAEETSEDASSQDDEDGDDEPKADDQGADTDIASSALAPDEVLDDTDEEVVPAPRSTGGSLARRDPMAVYMRETRRYPLLTPDEEHSLATRLVEHGDTAAARKLI